MNRSTDRIPIDRLAGCFPSINQPLTIRIVSLHRASTRTPGSRLELNVGYRPSASIGIPRVVAPMSSDLRVRGTVRFEASNYEEPSLDCLWPQPPDLKLLPTQQAPTTIRFIHSDIGARISVFKPLLTFTCSTIPLPPPLPNSYCFLAIYRTMSTNRLTDCSREREIMINAEMLMSLVYGAYTSFFVIETRYHHS